MSQVMEHIERLADSIGPRPATTDAEAQAADYIEEVFSARGLETERQDFECPRSDSWSHIVHGILVIGAAVVSVWSPLPALVLAVVASVLVWLDASMLFSVSRLLSRGPSQNIIARHVPHARRNERLKRIVIVAHYDSATPSFLTNPALARNLGTMAALEKWLPVAVSVLIAFSALPFASEWRLWVAYAALVAAAPLLLPLVAALQRLFGHAVDGANDNASGVAAMLAVMEAAVPAPEGARTQDPLRRGAQAVIESGALDDDVMVDYEPSDAGETQLLMRLDESPYRLARLEDRWPPGASRLEGPAWGGRGSSMRGSYEEGPDAFGDEMDEAAPWWEEDVELPGQRSLDIEADEEAALDDMPSETASGRRARSRRLRREEGDEGRGFREWLGIGRTYDVRQAGKEIGSWDNLDDDDDEFGFKAGSPSSRGLTGDLDPSSIAARIRRQVTEEIDRALAEKEIWFVATGASEPGGYGMRALLEAYGEELSDAMIINVDTVGLGAVSFVSHEGLAKRYRADRRLISQAKRTAREQDLPVRGAVRTGAVSDAAVALAKGYRAMSVMAFDINGRLPNWHWYTDTVDAVSEQTVQQAASFMSSLVRDL